MLKVSCAAPCEKIPAANYVISLHFASYSRSMKQLIHSTVVVLLALIGHHQLRAQATMYVHQTNLTQDSYPLDSIRKLTFPAGAMHVHRTAGDTIAYAFSNIQYVNFSGLSTGITAPLVQGSNAAVYPNPADDLVNVNFTSDVNETVTIEILDLQGRVLVAQQLTAAQSGSNRIALSTAGLAQGAYLCRITSTDRTENIKFLKD